MAGAKVEWPRGVRILGTAPLIGAIQRRRWDRYFEEATNVHIFRGVFDSFEAAAKTAPPTKPVTYDNESSANLYLNRMKPDEHDYPSMFWLSRSFDQGMRTVFDVGGSIGIKFVAFSALMPFPADLRWTVEDMPAVARRGQQFAAERHLGDRLRFTSDFADGDGSDVLFASGSLQYLPDTLEGLMSGYRTLPKRVIVNTTPIHPRRSFFTLNSVGSAFCPYRVRARQEFIDGIGAMGYALVDQWINPAKFMRIPFHDGLDLDHYQGFCFDRL